MNKRLITVVMLFGAILTMFGLAGCSKAGNDGPDLKINGKKFEIGDTRFAELVKAGYSLKKSNDVPCSNETQIPGSMVVDDLSMYKDDVEIGSIALKSSLAGSDMLSDCTSYHISFDVREKNKNLLQNLSIEGLPFITAKAVDLLPKLEKEFGKENIVVIYFGPKDLRPEELEQAQKLNIDVQKQIEQIVCYGNRGQTYNVEWSVAFDLLTQEIFSLDIRQGVPMATKRIYPSGKVTITGNGYQVMKLE